MVRWMSNRSVFSPYLSLVAVGRPREADEGTAGAHGLAAQLDIGRDVARDVGRGRFEAQELLNGVGDERPVLDQLASLVRVLRQNLAHPADEAIGRLVPRTGDHAHVDEDLVGVSLRRIPFSSSN